MRTTVRLDEHLLREAKQLAARTGGTLTGVIENALKEMLGRRGKTVRRTSAKLPTFRGNGLLPGVDLDDSAGLFDLMESGDDRRRRQRPRARLS
jgi:hypothetical protein